MYFVKILLLFSILFICDRVIYCDEHSHTYEYSEEVVVWMNTVGPYHNRQETYAYFSLPFCQGPKTGLGHYHETFGEALLGVELELSGLDMGFKRERERTVYCEVTLTEEKLEAFEYAVRNQYWYQLYLDDLPAWGLVGELDENADAYIYTHRRFDLGYNANQVVELNLTTSDRVRLQSGAVLRFTFEVKWQTSQIEFRHRFDKYLDPNFFQHRIHWFSIFNSFMMVIFLVGLVAMILMRTLRKDYARYAARETDEFDDLEHDLGDEYGWKQVHGDVFRAPSRPVIFSSAVGCGAQIFTISLLSVGLIILGEFWIERGTIITLIIFLYAVSAPVNGFVGGSLYSRIGGRHWIKQLFLSVFLLPLVVGGVAGAVQVVALAYHTARVLHASSIAGVVAIVLLVVFPLQLLGCVLGRNLAGMPTVPCRVNSVPRPIPEKKWYMEPAVIVMAGGVLPFGSIFIEMYFIFTSFWAYKVYYVFGFMLLVLLILIAVTSCVTLVATYFLLNSEDYRWQWTSLLAGASTSFYVYLYAIYYFIFKTKMYGLFQTSFYFGYMFAFCVGLGLMCGSVGFGASSLFVRKIYSSIKID